MTSWQPGEAIAVAQQCFEEWVKARGTTGSCDLHAAVRQVRAFLEAHGASRFQQLNGSSDEVAERIFNRAGFKRRNDDGQTEYLILLETFKNEVCKGHNHQSVLKELDKRSFLVRDFPNMTVKPRLPELGLTRVYCIWATILEADEC